MAVTLGLGGCDFFIMRGLGSAGKVFSPGSPPLVPIGRFIFATLPNFQTPPPTFAIIERSQMKSLTPLIHPPRSK
jgi:hypothetical protein